MNFREWLSGPRPGVKPFFIRGDVEGRFERVTYNREDWERECENVRYANSRRSMQRELPAPPEIGSSKEPDSVLSLLHPQVKLRGGADDEDDSDSGPVGPHRPTILEHRVLRGSE